MQPTVHVVATTFEGTRAALRVAVPMAHGLGARLVVVVPQIVGSRTDPHELQEETALFVQHYQHLVDETGGEARIEVCVCRGIDAVAQRLHAARATVVLGGPAGRWLTSPEERFAHYLSRLGQRVVFVASGPNTTQRRIAPLAAMV